jgi:UDP-hydrolysing UDP-N-acetyl-D-glucosamine 2-epimerase
MKILAVTGTRADWGLLQPVLLRMQAEAELDVFICATGQHLEAGETSLETMKVEGFEPDFHVDMGLGASYSPQHLSAAMGRGAEGIGRVLADLAPDIMLVLGDRYEMLTMVSSALVFRIPVAHLCGGDLTQGAFDDAIRHAITKLSALHFVTNNDAARRVIQMGEDPENVVVSGSPGIDRIKSQPIISRNKFLSDLGLDPANAFAMVSFHPETLAEDPSLQLKELLDALARRPDLGLLLTGSNADPGGKEIDRAFAEMAMQIPNTVFLRSLGSQRYFSGLHHAVALLGNSSSGLYEAPSFATPTVNIGARQKGRLEASSVITCDATRDAILAALDTAIAWHDGHGEVTNPFGDGNAAQRIVEKLLSIKEPRDLTRKQFREIGQ